MNLTWLLSILLLPGLTWVALRGPESIFRFFAANALVYGIVFFVVVLLKFPNASSEVLRRIAGWSTLMVATFSVLACTPALNLLWPHGMANLAKQEAELQNAIQVGMNPEEVRGVLNARKIQFNEFSEPTGGNVLTDFNATITAESGEQCS